MSKACRSMSDSFLKQRDLDQEPEKMGDLLCFGVSPSLLGIYPGGGGGGSLSRNLKRIDRATEIFYDVSFNLEFFSGLVPTAYERKIT